MRDETRRDEMMKEGMRDETARDETKRNFFYFLSHPPSLMVSYLLFVSSLISHSSSLTFSASLLGRQSGFGDLRESFTARQMGMGGCKIAATEDSTALFFNPAQLSKAGKLSIIAAPSVGSAYEKATHADASKSFHENNFIYLDLPNFSASYSFVRWTLAVGWASVNDFRYRHDAQTYLEGKLTSSKRAEDFGEMRVLAGAASYRFDRLALGISYLAYRGTPSFSFQNLSYNYRNGQLITSDVKEISKVFGGRQVLGGISCFPNDAIRFGTAVKGRFTMSETEQRIENGVYSQTGRQWRMPWEFGAGFACTFSQTASVPTFSFDAVKRWWSQTSVSVEGSPYHDAGYADTLSYFFGMEHHLTSAIPLRYGCSFVPFYGRGEADAFAVSLGSGYVWTLGEKHRISFEFSGEYQIRSTSDVPRLFPESADPEFPFINQDVVDSYVKRFMATISYRF